MNTTQGEESDFLDTGSHFEFAHNQNQFEKEEKKRKISNKNQLLNHVC